MKIDGQLEENQTERCNFSLHVDPCSPHDVIMETISKISSTMETNVRSRPKYIALCHRPWRLSVVELWPEAYRVGARKRIALSSEMSEMFDSMPLIPGCHIETCQPMKVARVGQT